jgi:hypothetical protein
MLMLNGNLRLIQFESTTEKSNQTASCAIPNELIPQDKQPL